MDQKIKLFSVTKNDFEWQFFRGDGSGGQKKNKTSSACRCIHPPSGAVGESKEDRQQHINRRTAFQRCVNSKEFQNWIKLTSAAISAGFVSIEKQINESMKEENIKVEYYVPKD